MYPSQISNRVAALKRKPLAVDPNSSGRSAAFVCGVSIEFELSIDEKKGIIVGAVFKTNGCGFTVAAADLISEAAEGLKLTELHALRDLRKLVFEEFGDVPVGRTHCFEICYEALQDALANYREKQIDNWNGEDALICSCFGVSEGEIEKVIADKNLSLVGEVGDACNAGTGCGTCQPLIQEILDIVRT